MSEYARDVHRDAKSIARRVDERRLELFARSECGTMHDEIEPAELLIDLLEHRMRFRRPMTRRTAARAEAAPAPATDR